MIPGCILAAVPAPLSVRVCLNAIGFDFSPNVDLILFFGLFPLTGSYAEESRKGLWLHVCLFLCHG